MVVSGDLKMDYYNEVEELLSNYKNKQKEIRVFSKEDSKQDFLKHCLDCLDDYEKELLDSIMIEKISIRQYSRQSGFSRAFVTKEKNRLIDLIAKFFQVNYS
ncbi:MAG: hypothetical protein WCR54_06630 [Clostridia bacterium]